MPRALLVACVLTASSAVAQTGRPTDDASRQDLAALLVGADEDYAHRDEPGRLDAVEVKLTAAERLAPNDYDVLWRRARLYFWRSDDPALSDREKSVLGKKGWEYGDRAIQANPQRVEGYDYAASGMGNYALGVGVLTALRQGIDGKFRERLGKAEQIDPGFQNGAIQSAWGRFYFKLPWPKHDPQKSERYLLEALKRNPDNVRVRVYLAELYADERHPKEAKQQLQKALAKPPGQYDAAEEKRWQQVARDELAKLR
jgi:tetratricopeptide (TPR) repeat protein